MSSALYEGQRDPSSKMILTRESTSAGAFPPGAIVWAKLRGHPWWPARVKDEADLPKNVLNFKKQNHIPVFFFGSDDYGWPSKDSIRDYTKYKEDFLKSSKGNKVRKAAVIAEASSGLEPPKKKFNSRTEAHHVLPENEVTEKLDTDSKKEEYHEADPYVESKDNIAEAKTDIEDDTRNDASKMELSLSPKEIQQTKRPLMTPEKDKKSGELYKGAFPPAACKPYDPEISKKDPSNFTTPERSLYKIRANIQYFMKRIREKSPSDPYPDELYNKASKSLSYLEKFPFTVELIKAMKIGKLIKILSKFSIEEDKHNMIPRTKILLEKINLLRHSQPKLDVNSGNEATELIRSTTPDNQLDNTAENNITKVESNDNRTE